MECHAEPRGGDDQLAGSDMFWEDCHAAKILADAPGDRNPGNVHHRHPRRSVYTDACVPRRFERDGLLPRCDDRVVGRLILEGLG